MSALRRLRSLAGLALRFEVSVYVALWRWVTRRPAVPAGATPIGYSRMVGPVMWLFIWGSAVEVVALDLVVHHYGWTRVRVPLLVLGVWSLLWMLGMLAAMRTRPHVLTETDLRVRSGLHDEVVVPLSAVVALARTERELSSTIRNHEVVDGVLLVGVSGRTNLLLTLDGPTDLLTPKGVKRVDTLGVWVDEPHEVATLLRRSAPAG